jgi:hypothetical protein
LKEENMNLDDIFQIIVYVPIFAVWTALSIFNSNLAEDRPWTRTCIIRHAVLASVIIVCGVVGIAIGMYEFIAYILLGILYLYLDMTKIRYIGNQPA